MADRTPPRGLLKTLTFLPSGARSTAAGLVSPGDVLDRRFEIRRIIARGGMGVVAEAEDRALGTRVALKFIQPALAADPAVRERFRREILLARRVTHRNICRIFELFSLESNGESALFLTMELLEGETLSDRIRVSPLLPADALPLVRQMVDALEAAHAQGIVHRDFKSSNVLLVRADPSERVVVTDFGIARALKREGTRDAAMTGEGLMGTPGYMAPEQVLGGRVTPATDIYALGVVIFEMLSGQLPFQAETPVATALLRVSQPPPRISSLRPGVDPTWDAVVFTCMAREPVFRYATVRDVLRALEGGPATPLPKSVLRETLPAEVTPFLGRSEEVAAAAALLRRRGVRLLTLTGPGGTGKTRLSIEVARALADDFTDGVSFVSLSNVSDPTRVPHAIAAALELKEVVGTLIEEVVSTFLRSRKQLLVLDNFEHVLPAAPIIARLLRVAPGLSVLVTSRSLLHLSGEHDMPVPGMGVSALGNDAVLLFAERAQALSPSFEVNDENAGDVLALCQRLDGLPLAIELAAARIRRETPRSILERLSQSGALRVLGHGFHDAERRQWTLRDTIAWSDKLLTSEEQALFRALGIFASGTTVAGAAAVTGLAPDAALELLGSLADKSLVQRTQNPRIEDRFVMLQTLREYALAELEAAGTLAVTRLRHANHCLAVAEQAAEVLRGPEQGRLLAELEADHDEMRTGLRWLTAEGQHDEALRLCVALAPFWDVRGHWVEGHRLLTSAFEQAPAAPLLLRAAALHWLGVQGWCLGTLEESRRDHDAAIALYRSAGEDRFLGESLHRAGWTAQFQGDLPAMQRFTDELTELAERRGDRRFRALARSNQSLLAAELGDVPRAVSLADEALELMREVGDAYAYGQFQNARGEVARLAGDDARAKVAYEAELRVAEQLGCKRFLAVGNGNLGQVSASQGRWSDSLQRLKIALQVQQGLGERRNLPIQLLNAAEALMHLGDPELAARVMGAADALLDSLPIHAMASDRGPTERFRRAIADRIPSELLERLRREGAALTLEEAMLRVVAFPPSTA
jgi:predicted ATPase/tRNA A-37 threonylcarbamoyl transferase component Bud32/tetratricopeptide (TPR) repeat protein